MLTCKMYKIFQDMIDTNPKVIVIIIVSGLDLPVIRQVIILDKE